MDLDKLIRDFLEERERLDQVITYFESRLGKKDQTNPTKKTDSEKDNSLRKRRKMTASERKAVSERMRRYWSDRKKPG